MFDSKNGWFCSITSKGSVRCLYEAFQQSTGHWPHEKWFKRFWEVQNSKEFLSLKSVSEKLYFAEIPRNSKSLNCETNIASLMGHTSVDCLFAYRWYLDADAMNGFIFILYKSLHTAHARSSRETVLVLRSILTTSTVKGWLGLDRWFCLMLSGVLLGNWIDFQDPDPIWFKIAYLSIIECYSKFWTFSKDLSSRVFLCFSKWKLDVLRVPFVYFLFWWHIPNKIQNDISKIFVSS